jgi:hypothetical protein
MLRNSSLQAPAGMVFGGPVQAVRPKACLYTSHQGVGLLHDLQLIQDLLFDHYDVDVVYMGSELSTPGQSNNIFANYEVGIFIQEFDINWMDRNKKNILIANEEWTQLNTFSNLRLFDKIITKSTFAKQLLSPYNKNVINCGFISRDRYDSSSSNIVSTKSLLDTKDLFLHVAGQSQQKGTERVFESFNGNCENIPITILQSNGYYSSLSKKPNITYIDKFLSDEEITNQINKHSIHLGPSYYEGWGHYVYEGMSVGALLYVTKIPMFLEWIDPDLVVFLDCEFDNIGPGALLPGARKYSEISQINNTYSESEKQWYLKYRLRFPHHIGWTVNQDHLNDEILNYKKNLKNHKPDLVRKYFKHINQQNSKKLFYELTNI